MEVGGVWKQPRRGFWKSLLAAGAGAGAANSETLFAQGSQMPFPLSSTNTPGLQTGSDVGSLWPLVEKLASRVYFPLAFTQPRLRSLEDWKRMAQGKIVDLLQYNPPKWPAQERTIESIDKGDYVLEKVRFNTSPYSRAPAYVLAPKDAPRRQTPAIVALHDHSGFYLWGKEKLVETDAENAGAARVQATLLCRPQFGDGLGEAGFLVEAMDWMYWGERRMILDDDPEDWRARPNDLAADRVDAFNARIFQMEPLVNRTLTAAGTTWPGLIFWEDIRTVDYLLTRPEVGRNRIGAVGF